ncbi:MAG: RiPP maturation radical SAM C-methyltransferase [Pseudomonadota bacterium]
MLDAQTEPTRERPPVTKDLKVAFVYPPFGPPNLANLGIAILAAGLEERGFLTRTFYWNYRLLDHLPGDTLHRRRQIYTLFTQRDLFPWNEWVFTRQVFGAEMEDQLPTVRARLARLNQELGAALAPFRPEDVVLQTAEAVPGLVDRMVDDLAEFDVVGITTTFYQNGAALALAKRLKERRPNVRVILGGANCDGEMGLALMENFDFLDFVFSGEVDFEFPEFITRLEEGGNLAEVRGLIRRHRGKVVRGLPSVPLENMNELPVPVFDDFIAERKVHGLFDPETLVLPLESSRGCWWGAKHHCTFCGLNAGGMSYRQKDEERFRAEVREVADRYDAKYLFMADNILSARYYRDFIQWAKDNALDISYFYEIKSNVNRAHVADLADAGVTMVQPGIESLSTPILKLMKKGVRGIQNVAFLKYASEYGVIPAWNFLAGFPGEDPAEYEMMVNLVPLLTHLAPPNGVVDIEFHRFSPYHNDPDAFGIRLRPHPNYFLIYPLPEDQVARLAYVFEVEGRTPMSLSYLADLNTAVNGWIQNFRQGRSSLTWVMDGEDLLVRDRRRGLAQRDWRLKGFAAEVYHAFDAPVTLSAVVDDPGRFEERIALASDGPGDVKRASVSLDFVFPIVPRPAEEHVVEFTREAFAEDSEACLAPLTDAGVIYREDNLYVSLAVAEGARRINGGWRQIGI